MKENTLGKTESNPSDGASIPAHEHTSAAEPLDFQSIEVGDVGKDPFCLVDPELLAVVKTLPSIVITPEVLAEARKLPLVDALPAPMPQPVSRHIPGPPGAPDLRIFVVDPSPGEKNRPVVLHTHGGGYLAENTMLYPIIQMMAHDCACVVVSVDYRLAPETRYPGSLEDNYAALQWVHRNAEVLGIDPERIAVAGESAGGGHAAALALRARDLGEIALILQILIYPMLDDRTGSLHPAPASMGRFLWNEQNNRYGWTALLGVPAGSPAVPASAVPARVEDLTGVAPAWIGTGALDLFAEESIEYARRLMVTGVTTNLMVCAGAYHGFDLLVPEADISKRFTESWKAALRKAFVASVPAQIDLPSPS